MTVEYTESYIYKTGRKIRFIIKLIAASKIGIQEISKIGYCLRSDFARKFN